MLPHDRYRPAPIPTSGVALPPELETLLAVLALGYRIVPPDPVIEKKRN